MSRTTLISGMTATGVLLVLAGSAPGQDWPQWRGPNRDAKASGFKAPATWPPALTKKWKVTVGDGVATPALVGDRLYVFSRETGNEVLRCLDAASGKEIWQDKYESQGATGPASGYAGPRSSPTVADGKVITLGVRGVLSCLDAASGKVLWRKDDFKGSWPMFFTSSSPVVADGLCFAQLGGGDNGAIVAYDLARGQQKWKWTGDSPAYASPVLMTVGDAKLVVAETQNRIVALTAADGKLVWETPFAAPRGPGGYNAATPIVEGQTVIFSGGGRGTKAVKLEKEGERFVGHEAWSNKDTAVQFNTPVLKDGVLYGLTQRNEYFGIDTQQQGKTAWHAPAGKSAAAPPAGGGAHGGGQPGGPGGGGRGRGMRGGRGGGGGYGSIVDAGSVLFALTPAAELVVFAPSGTDFKQLAKYKVADKETHAYPVIAGNRIYIKDRDSLTLWTIE